MVIKILGKGCPKCRKLESNVNEALKQTGIHATVEKVTDLNDITKYNVVITPGFVIDEKVVSTGKVLTVDEIKRILIENKA